MLGVDSEIGTSALPLWIAAGSAAGLVVVCARALSRGRPGTAPPIGWSGVVLLGIVFGAAAAWALLDPARDRAAERRALELRAQELAERALAPGSALACLDPVVDTGVATACETTLFAAPASVAAAVSYVAAQFALFADMVAYEKRGGAGVDSTLLTLRRSLEADRFGFLANVLAAQEGCTSQNCAPLELLRDTRLVRAHLSVQTLDHYVEHYQADWAKSATAEEQPAATATAEPERQRKTLVNIDFPSAASIPPVSIMNPEPKGPILPGQAAAAAANPNPEPPFRRGRKQAALPAAASPRPAAEATQDPVWTPASQAAPTAPAASVVSGAAAAPQHNPSGSPQGADTTHTQ
ncbi:MAG TPA: hypothetical protein VGJ20_33810 [Xanthobacteraceae bacterium]|jgi:hypothetical protein